MQDHLDPSGPAITVRPLYYNREVEYNEYYIRWFAYGPNRVFHPIFISLS